MHNTQPLGVVQSIRPIGCDLNRLERLGWAQYAADRFGIMKGEAAVLSRLVLDSPGIIVSHSALMDMVQRQGEPKTDPNRRSTKLIMRIRSALADAGVRHAVVSEKGMGYYVTHRDAARIREIVEG